MRYLQRQLAAGLVDRGGHAPESGDHGVIVRAELQAARSPLRAHEGVAADDEPHPAPGELRVEAGQLRRGATLRVGQPFPSSRPHEAIRQLHPANGGRFEEHRGHEASLRT